jgi:hypothetical protein
MIGIEFFAFCWKQGSNERAEPMLASALFPALDGAPVALQRCRTLRQAE